MGGGARLPTMWWNSSWASLGAPTSVDESCVPPLPEPEDDPSTGKGIKLPTMPLELEDEASSVGTGIRLPTMPPELEDAASTAGGVDVPLELLPQEVVAAT